MHELSGSSMKLNFNPCIYNSMSFVIIKKGEIVSPKALTLVLMMINSCSYSTNDLVLFKFQIINQDLSWYLALIKDSKSSFEGRTCRIKSSNLKIASSTQG